jgi:hypothetical protein
MEFIPFFPLGLRLILFVHQKWPQLNPKQVFPMKTPAVSMAIFSRWRTSMDGNHPRRGRGVWFGSLWLIPNSKLPPTAKK